ncbi:alpha/beta hydrolase [Knoellia subterranea]|nr:alpha/beta hydrolase [Knoellia subterranea]
MRRLLLALLALILVTGCGGEGDPNAAASGSPAPSTSTLPTCVDSDEWSALAPGGPAGMTAGDGELAVVFANTADGTACDWYDYASSLVKAGHRVAAWDYATAGGPVEDRVAELDAVVDQVRGAGSSEVVVVGGSRGGCLALLDAAQNPDVSAVGVLSCAKVWNRQDPTPLAEHLPKVTVPVLSVIAATDPDVPLAETKADLASLGSADKDLLVVQDSSDHGTALLASPTVTTALDEFVATQAG